MSLTSVLFFAFAALVVLLYYILPKRVQWLVLLAASLVLYSHAAGKSRSLEGA